jgi:hypothetical protein
MVMTINKYKCTNHQMTTEQIEWWLYRMLEAYPVRLGIAYFM